MQDVNLAIEVISFTIIRNTSIMCQVIVCRNVIASTLNLERYPSIVTGQFTFTRSCQVFFSSNVEDMVTLFKIDLM